MIGRRFWMTGLLAMLALLAVAAKSAEDWPPGMAILHGFVFHDLNSDGRWNHPNGNGPYDRLNPDRWEPGLGGVMFSVVCDTSPPVLSRWRVSWTRKRMSSRPATSVRCCLPVSGW